MTDHHGETNSIAGATGPAFSIDKDEPAHSAEDDGPESPGHSTDYLLLF